MAINRVTFGLDRFSFYPLMKKWRIGDAVLIPVVPNEHNIFYSLAIPIIVILALTATIGHPKHKLYLGYISVLGLLVSFFVNGLVTDALKNWIGRHRPDFISRCIPKEGTPLNTLVFAKDVCTTTNLEKLADGFRTTPSGHSSTAFSGLGYLTLWLYGQFLTEHPLTGSWRKVLASVPAFGAILIALSRTEDYRHHFIDVILGSIIGITIAYWSYRRNFPELTSLTPFKPHLDDSDAGAEEIKILKADRGEDANSHLLQTHDLETNN
ncbi:Lipid phosphate phosphatase 1 [Wickerhamomyces ciferrii]|uniref:Lipid phosphate phosphatase 1 n=1 Tax=Wickerhamomyces ciferrii (strain ATCC 14091 / BCRC 22168 / CBS 111 / JCM 3599 / NBRC 0793 / NRRL Y-1031 F-60-10) TaxID=1206466 RepID=K0KP69_WICCF|nr:Lipid phosphate phosphatase 1 [Wickerhamomyces ciferrii]CCH47075.1 Lipid phosphate phosphatase 1 [Wickerhamomyces ciferrii]